MADFGDYPPNMAPQDALIVRAQAGPSLAVTPYTGEDLARPQFGPANPFRDESQTLTHGTAASSNGLKRKNILTGFATETYISEHTFRSKHRAVEANGAPEREGAKSGRQIKEEAKVARQTRVARGDATIAEGEGAYVGPWAGLSRREEYEEVEDGEDELSSGEEYEEVEVDEDGNVVGEDVVESGTVLQAPTQAIARRREVEDLGAETTTFHGESEYDYQGRTYMHIPQDLDIDLQKEAGSFTNYIPKKQIHVFKGHTKAVTALRWFPTSGHLLLSGSADNTIKIWDAFHERELLRTYSGHTKAITDVSFNIDGTRLLSGSYDRQMKLWDTETGKCISKFSTGKTPHCLVFNPSEEHSHEFLAGMSDKKIVQFDTRAGDNKTVQEYDHHLAAINTITFVGAPQWDQFMTTSDDKSIMGWEWNIPVPTRRHAEVDAFALTRSCLHPSGKYVLYQSSDNQILVYSAGDKFRQNRKKSFRGHNNAGSAIDVDVSPDGQFVASGDTGGYLVFWDWKTQKMYHKLETGRDAVTCVKWHPQETSKVVSAGASGLIRYWD